MHQIDSLFHGMSIIGYLGCQRVASTGFTSYSCTCQDESASTTPCGPISALPGHLILNFQTHEERDHQIDTYSTTGYG